MQFAFLSESGLDALGMGGIRVGFGVVEDFGDWNVSPGFGWGQRERVGRSMRLAQWDRTV